MPLTEQDVRDIYLKVFGHPLKRHDLISGYLQKSSIRAGLRRRIDDERQSHILIWAAGRRVVQ